MAIFNSLLSVLSCKYRSRTSQDLNLPTPNGVFDSSPLKNSVGGYYLFGFLQ